MLLNIKIIPTQQTAWNALAVHLALRIHPLQPFTACPGLGLLFFSDPQEECRAECCFHRISPIQNPWLSVSLFFFEICRHCGKKKAVLPTRFCLNGTRRFLTAGLAFLQFPFALKGGKQLNISQARHHLTQKGS